LKWWPEGCQHWQEVRRFGRDYGQVGRQWLGGIGPETPISRVAHQLGYAPSTMGLLDKLRLAKKPAIETGPPDKGPNVIQVFDKSGNRKPLRRGNWQLTKGASSGWLEPGLGATL